MGFLVRDPVAATGMGVLAGAWATAALTTLTSPPGATSAGLGVLLLTAAVAMQVPASAAAASELVPAAVMSLAGIRFTGSAAWQSAAGCVGLALGPLARHRAGRTAVRGEGPLAAGDLAAEAGVRPQL